MKLFIKSLITFLVILNVANGQNLSEKSKKIVYLVSDIRITFWNIMAKGIKDKGKKETELTNTAKALKSNPSGLIISPINSSTVVTILKFSKIANTPVVISDIGTDFGEYVSFISSNNENGAYNIGKVLTKKMKKLGYDKNGSVGIIAIPQKRANGKARTKGFMRALEEDGVKGAGLLQQIDFSYEETFKHSMKLIKENPDLKALWLQGSDRYKGALDAIEKSGKKGKVLLLCFDAEPEFLKLIPKGILVGAAMQQPYLMGEKAVESLIQHLNGKVVAKQQQLDILAISTENIKKELPTIKRNVLGIK